MRLPFIPSLSLSPFLSPFFLSSRRLKRRGDVRGGEGNWGGRVTRWGLFLMRGVNFFFFSKTKSVYFTLALSLGRACLNRFSKLVILVFFSLWVLVLFEIYYWVFVHKRERCFLLGQTSQASSGEMPRSGDDNQNIESST